MTIKLLDEGSFLPIYDDSEKDKIDEILDALTCDECRNPADWKEDFKSKDDEPIF